MLFPEHRFDPIRVSCLPVAVFAFSLTNNHTDRSKAAPLPSPQAVCSCLPSRRRWSIVSDRCGTNKDRIPGLASEFFCLHQLVIDVVGRRDMLTPYQGPPELHQPPTISVYLAGDRCHQWRPSELHFVQCIGNAIVSNNRDMLFTLELSRSAQSTESAYVVSCGNKNAGLFRVF
jgi:hypothetical protein